MSGYTVPLSSSPPSTPGSRRSHTDKIDDSFSMFGANPSTTPAGPPPSARSFTPAGPPPSTIFGSSQLASGHGSFKSQAQRKLDRGSMRSRNSPSFKTVHPKKASSLRRVERPRSSPQDGHRSTFKVPSSSLRSSLVSNGDAIDEYDEDVEDGPEDSLDEEEEQASENGNMELDAEDETRASNIGGGLNGHIGNFQSSVPYDWGQHGSSRIGQTPGDTKRSQTNFTTCQSSSHQDSLQLGKKKDSSIPMIAKGLAKYMPTASLNESDNMVLETEDLVAQLYQQDVNGQDQERLVEAALTVVPEALSKLWQSCCNEARRRPPPTEVIMTGIGPNDNEPPLLKATFLSTLLLKLHHPPPAKGKQAFALSRSQRQSDFLASLQVLDAPTRLEAYPKLLLDWLDQNCNPYRNAILDVMTHYPNSTAHLNFWNLVFAYTLRGKLADVLRIFKESDFSHARTAREDGQSSDGYRGVQLKNITQVIGEAVKVLEKCPAIQDDDWDISGTDWAIYRRQVGLAMEKLATFAEGRDRDLDPAESTFQAENFGMRSTSNALSQSARRAESKVPWAIYQNLKTLYGILLGGTTEIVSVSQDWLEAVFGLTVWWDGDDNDEIAVGTLAMTRRSLRRSQANIPRSVDVNTTAAYQRRLAYAFERVINEADDATFQINSNNPMEVGLACIFEGNVEAVLNFLRGWSLPIVCAVTEVATEGGWFQSVPGSGRPAGFDESDLIVLSYRQPEKSLNRDGILLEYSEALFAKDSITDSRSGVSKEGWEMSVELLSRLEDASLANKHVGEMLSSLELHSDLRADKLINLCRGFGLEKEACEIAEKYGNVVAESSDKYGTALVYYARSHNAKKVKDVLDLLISLCLVQSIAYPPISSLDINLGALVSEPADSLATIADLDAEAAVLLQQYLGGYATLRKFYDLRDEEVNLKKGQKPSLRPIARKKAAAASLLTVIASAADNIQGGLYDETQSAIVQVDGLLALLGEAMVFIDQPTRILNLSQILLLLRAIEDLQTVHKRIYSQCEECLKSTLDAARGIKRPAPPRELLKKSISDLTGSSGFSLVGSEMLVEDDTESSNTNGSAVLVRMNGNGNGNKAKSQGKRGWDWRTGMKKGATGEDLLSMLRLGLAKELARAWIEDEEA